MNDTIYQKLAEHLDQLPGGFAPSETGADIRLLQRLFTPKEAELATYLSLDRLSAETIAEIAGLPLAETETHLNTMAKKGLIFSTSQENDPILYQAVPFIIGI